MTVATGGPHAEDHERDRQEGFRTLLVPVLQTLILLACITCVTLLGESGVIDAPAITAIVGAIVGSVGVLAGVGIGRSSARNGGSR